MTTLLVTTGATVTFKSLVEHVISSQFLFDLLAETNISKLIIQYGNETKDNTNVSKQFFESLISKSSIIEKFSLQVVSDTENLRTYKSSTHNFQMIVFPFSKDITKYIEESDIVISHAGTGSIIDTLRLNKPLIVVTNDALMDNHQEEIANEFAKLNYCRKVSNNMLRSNPLIKHIHDISSNQIKFSHLPKVKDRFIETIVYNEMAN